MMHVGVTGHQHLESEATIVWYVETIEAFISRYSITLGFSSLAIGADQLYANCLKQYAIPYVAIIPSLDYEKTFQNNQALMQYQDLLQAASERIVLPFAYPHGDAFYAAGKDIVDRSDCLIALWNGLPAKGLGGTGDVVSYALLQHKPIIHLDPLSRSMRLL